VSTTAQDHNKTDIPAMPGWRRGPKQLDRTDRSRIRNPRGKFANQRIHALENRKTSRSI